MVTILLCQYCGDVIDYVTSEKVSKMYGACHQCDDEKKLAGTVEED